MMNKSLRYDILKELFNISVGKAASLLSEIVNKKIILNVPDIKILDLMEAKVIEYEHFPKSKDGTLMASAISFQENIEGRANLIFPTDKMRTFINLCMNDEEDEGNEAYFTEVDFDVIKEIGNIVLNSIVGEVGNYLNIKLSYTLPEVKIFNLHEFVENMENTEFTCILLLYITFNIDDTEIEGAILIDLSLKSLNSFIKKIDELEERLYE